MNKLIDELMKEFKKLKRVRGNLFYNFISFVNIYLSGINEDVSLSNFSERFNADIANSRLLFFTCFIE